MFTFLLLLHKIVYTRNKKLKIVFSECFCQNQFTKRGEENNSIHFQLFFFIFLQMELFDLPLGYLWPSEELNVWMCIIEKGVKIESPYVYIVKVSNSDKF